MTSVAPVHDLEGLTDGQINSPYLCLFSGIINFSIAAAVINGIDLLSSVIHLIGAINVSEIFGFLLLEKLLLLFFFKTNK